MIYGRGKVKNKNIPKLKNKKGTAWWARRCDAYLIGQKAFEWSFEMQVRILKVKGEEILPK